MQERIFQKNLPLFKNTGNISASRTYSLWMEGDTVSTVQSTALAARLYERYRQKMYATAFRILRNADDAEDAVADAVVRMLRHIDQFTEIACTDTAPSTAHRDRNEALLCVYTRHAAIDICRRRRPTASIDESYDLPDPAETPEDVTLAREQIDELRRAIDTINPDFREVILLRYAHDMSVREIADALELKEVTVRTRLLRGKNALYKQLSGKKEICL